MPGRTGRLDADSHSPKFHALDHQDASLFCSNFDMVPDFNPGLVVLDSSCSYLRQENQV